MASINDWAAKAAHKIRGEFRGCKEGPTQERCAAIIATFADPLISLLREARKDHHHTPDGDVRDGACCPQCCCQSWPEDPEADFEPEPNSDQPCTCGAAEWNAKIDKVLS